MPRMISALAKLIFGRILIVVLALLWGTYSAAAEKSTLGRLSFWLPPERASEFQAEYESSVLPILIRHGATASAETGRTTIDSVFARLFAFDAPEDINHLSQAVAQDSAWPKVLTDLGERYGTASVTGLIRHRFECYGAPAGSGASVVVGRRPGRWRTFTAKDGLISGGVVEIAQDAQGGLWFGTTRGLSRFDGVRWETLELEHGPAGFVRAMLVDRDGILWVGVRQAVYRLARNRPERVFETDGVIGLRAIFQDRAGNIWFGTTRGAVKFDGHSARTYGEADGLSHVGITSIDEDREGRLWFGTDSGGVYRYDGASFAQYDIESGLLSNQIHDVCVDDRNRIWIGTGAGASVYDPDQEGEVVFHPVDPLKGQMVRFIFQDGKKRFWFSWFGGVGYWFGSDGGGIWLYDPRIKSGAGSLATGDAGWTSFTTVDGLAHNAVITAFEDNEGYLWFGTGGGGASRYDEDGFSDFTVEQGLASNDIRSMALDRRGDVWFGTTGGVTRFDGRTMTTFDTNNGLAHRYVFSILEDRNRIFWFGSPTHGVTRFDPKVPNGEIAWTTFSSVDGLTGDLVGSMAQDTHGNIWFGGDGVVSCYDGEGFRTYASENSLVEGVVRAIFTDRDGNVWFGSNSGLTRYDGEKFERVREDTLRAWSIHQDRDGRMWFGIYDGRVVCYDGKTWSEWSAVEDTGIPLMYEIMQDNRGHLWFAMFQVGVGHYDGKAFQILREEDGLIDSGVRAVLQDRRGDYWFGTNRGVTRYRPKTPVPPRIALEAVVADQRYEGAARVSVPSTNELAAFEFRGGNLKTRPGGTLFRYRLLGLDDMWHTTRQMRVEYTGLPTGEYTFEVEAVDRDLVYSRTPARAHLHIHPPYERIGALLGLGIALVLAAWQTVRVIRRDRRLRQSNQALSNANREIRLQTERKSAFLASMSHELRTPMNAIIGFTRMVLRRAGDVLPEQQKENLNKVTEAANHLLNLINDLLDLSKIEAGRMDVEAKPFSVQKLIASCCGVVEPLVKAGVELRYEVSDDVGEACTDEGKLRHVIGNLLGNAVKFTEKGKIKVTVTSQALGVTSQKTVPSGLGGGLSTRDPRPATDFLVIAVSDTGIGMPEEALGTIFDEFQQVKGSNQTHKGTGLGLAITKKYTELLGGTIRVESEVGTGSTFTVRVPAVYQDVQVKPRMAE